MIQPKPKPGLGIPRGFAVGLTLALLLGVQAGLEAISVPAFASSRDMIRELDPLIFERFAMPAPPESDPEESEDEMPEEAPEEVASLSFEQEVSQAMEELERRFGSDPTPPLSVERGAGAADAPAPGISADVSTDRFESLFGTTDELVAGRTVRGRAGRPETAGAGIGIGITERPAGTIDSSTGSGVSPEVAVQTGADRSAAEAAADVEVTEYPSEGFNRSEADLLAAWMRTHAVELPVGIRAHINYEPTFLTAAAAVVSDGRRWELYLMFNEVLQEVHVVLVEGDRSVYLIDRGFQETSRSLREGTVRRSRGEIVAVDSRTSAASSERAREFYDVFLSWWETTKAESGDR